MDSQTEDSLIKKRFVTEAELDERRKVRQEEWEKVRKPDDPEECPEEVYDPRSLYEKLQEQKEKKQSEFEEQFKFKNMVRGLDEDETNYLDEVSRQRLLLEKQRRDEDDKELTEYRISNIFDMLEPTFNAKDQGGILHQLDKGGLNDMEYRIGGQCVSIMIHPTILHCLMANISPFISAQKYLHIIKMLQQNLNSCCLSLGARTKLAANAESKKDTEKKMAAKPAENKNKFSQAKLLAGAVKRKRSQVANDSETKDNYASDKEKYQDLYWHRLSTSSEVVKKQKVDHVEGSGQDDDVSCDQTHIFSTGMTIQHPSASVCVGILPGLGAYSGSSDSDAESSSDSDIIINTGGRIISSVFRSHPFPENP